MRASSLRSGPIANGVMATKIRKKTAPIEAPPPIRRAIRHSRRKRAAAAFLYLTCRLRRAEPSRNWRPSSPSGACVAATINPPPVKCARMISARRVCARASSAEVGSSSSQSGRYATRSRAKATRRFWPADSALTGRRATRREADAIERGAHVHGLGGAVWRRAISRQHGLPEFEIFARGERALQRVGMTEIMGLLANFALFLAALKREGARRQRQQPADGAQQARFARAIGAGDDQSLALRNRERQVAKTDAGRLARS